jgi:CoA:oxalate CoA-transferase
MEATGSPDGPPTLVGEAVSDVVSGLFASWGILAALLARERTGKGTQVDIAMLDSTLVFNATSVSRYLFTGKSPVRVGNRHPLSAPFGVYTAEDGHYVLAVLNNKLFGKLCELLDRPELAQDPRFVSDEERSKNEPLLRAAIEAWSRKLTVEQVIQRLEDGEIPAAPIWNIEQALNSPQSLHRAVIQPVEDPELPGLRLPVQPLKFSGYPPTAIDRAPRLGEHTDATLIRLLGLSAEKIAQLRDLGAFGHPPVTAGRSKV